MEVHQDSADVAKYVVAAPAVIEVELNGRGVVGGGAGRVVAHSEDGAARPGIAGLDLELPDRRIPEQEVGAIVGVDVARGIRG